MHPVLAAHARLVDRAHQTRTHALTWSRMLADGSNAHSTKVSIVCGCDRHVGWSMTSPKPTSHHHALIMEANRQDLGHALEAMAEGAADLGEALETLPFLHNRRHVVVTVHGHYDVQDHMSQYPKGNTTTIRLNALRTGEPENRLSPLVPVDQVAFARSLKALLLLQPGDAWFAHDPNHDSNLPTWRVNDGQHGDVVPTVRARDARTALAFAGALIKPSLLKPGAAITIEQICTHTPSIVADLERDMDAIS